HPSDEHKQALVGHSPGKGAHQSLMVYRPEVVLQIDINDPIVPFFQILRCRLDGRVTASTWTKPVARVMKSRLVNGLKYPTHRLLHNAIDHIRDPQRTLSTAAFRDPNPANVTRPELSRQQFIAQFSTNVGPVLSHLLNALSIWSRGTLVSCHCLKRHVQL